MSDNKIKKDRQIILFPRGLIYTSEVKPMYKLTKIYTDNTIKEYWAAGPPLQDVTIHLDIYIDTSSEGIRKLILERKEMIE
jgi:hypothetical protein